MTMQPSGPAGARVADLLASAAGRGLDRLDAQWLLLHAWGREASQRAWLLANDHLVVPADAAQRYERLCERRAAGEPLAYLVGTKAFHGLVLEVDARVLVPRPDTETLVDWALERLRGQASPRVIDLGTGSGAIALSIRRACPDAEVHAVDASADALDVARANARRLGLPVRFAQGDWLDGADGGFALIVANPPYIAAGDPHLPALAHEPIVALVAGADGLQDIRRIVAAAPARLAEGGWLLLEHGHDQAAAVRSLMNRRGFLQVQSRLDLAGIERCTGGMWRTVK